MEEIRLVGSDFSTSIVISISLALDVGFKGKLMTDVRVQVHVCIHDRLIRVLFTQVTRLTRLTHCIACLLYLL
jgi:hypothetical protein